jgi:hypothetical protein
MMRQPAHEQTALRPTAGTSHLGGTSVALFRTVARSKRERVFGSMHVDWNVLHHATLAAAVIVATVVAALTLARRRRAPVTRPMAPSPHAGTRVTSDDAWDWPAGEVERFAIPREGSAPR